MVRLTDHDALSHETVRRRLAEDALKPWQQKMWCIPQVDGTYVARMEDVLDLCAEDADPKRRSFVSMRDPTQLIGEGVVRLAVLGRRGSLMSMTTSPNPYHGFRFPAEIIEHAVWLYHCFSLSLRDVETILAARGVVVSYKSIREWSLRFRRLFANALKRRRPRPGDNWLLDEVFLRIGGKLQYLWRAVDQDGHVLDILVQSRRNAKAARRFFRKLLKGLQYTPRVIITDKLKSYAAAKRKILPGVEHRQSRYLNNRAEVSHQPTRRRERQMQRFKSARQAQRFLSTHGRIHNHFQLRRHRLSAVDYRTVRDDAFRTWRDVAGVPATV